MGPDKNCSIGEDCGEGVYAGLICGRGSCFSSVGREVFVGGIQMVLCYSDTSMAVLHMLQILSYFQFMVSVEDGQRKGGRSNVGEDGCS